LKKENSATRSLALSFYTFLSRILGLVRDHYMAVTFGTGWVASAFSVAYRFPNMFRNLLAEGTLSQSFMPIYSEAEKQGSIQPAIVAGTVLTFLTFILSAFVGLFMIFAPFFIPYLVGGSLEYSNLVIKLSLILFVIIMTASLSSIFIAISNSKQKFFVPSLSPIILNLSYLIVFWFVLPHLDEMLDKVTILSYGIIMGGICQLLVQSYYVKKLGLAPKLNFNWKHPAIKNIFKLMIPAVIGGGFYQISLLIDVFLANYIQNQNPGLGAVVSLDYSQRLIQLPTGIIGVALATTTLPTLLASIKKDETHLIPAEIVSVVSFALYITLPAAMGFFILGIPIIDSLYYGGKWDSSSTMSTYAALKFYALAIPMYSLNKIFTSSYYAFKDTKTPLRINMVSFAINLSTNLLLMGVLQHAALALSSAISAMITFALLFYNLRKHGIQISKTQLWGKTKKFFFPLLAMAIVLLFFRYMISTQVFSRLENLGFSFANQSRIFISLAIASSSITYFIASGILNLPEFQLVFGKILGKIKRSKT
jgi:putative peptidoglycan lipid II flippase